MGAYLSQPITDKESSDGEDARFKYGTTAMQGWRTNMEVRLRELLDTSRGTPFFSSEWFGSKEENISTLQRLDAPQFFPTTPFPL